MRNLYFEDLSKPEGLNEVSDYNLSLAEILVAEANFKTKNSELQAQMEAQEKSSESERQQLKKRMPSLDLRQDKIITTHQISRELFDTARQNAGEVSAANLEELEQIAASIQEDSQKLEDAGRRARQDREHSWYVQHTRKALLNDLGLFLLVGLGALGFAKGVIWGHQSQAFPTSFSNISLYLGGAALIIYLLGKVRDSVFLKVINGANYCLSTYESKRTQLAVFPAAFFLLLTASFLSLWWPESRSAESGNDWTQLGSVGIGTTLLGGVIYSSFSLKEFILICWNMRPELKKRSRS